jgi:DNA-binding response OmpR family regulator
MAKRILLVEDEDLLIEVLEKRLLKEGYEVVIARDGEEGLSKMREMDPKPDLVLLDIIMPKKDGFEVMEEMKKDESLKNITVMVISNSGQPVELDKAKELGAKDWIIKTDFNPDEVVVKVKRLIG